MLSNTANVPAKVISDFSKQKSNKLKKPILKAAYVEESFYIGENNLEALIHVKSKNELIADVIALLQSPAKNVCIRTPIRRFYYPRRVENVIGKIKFIVLNKKNKT